MESAEVPNPLPSRELTQKPSAIKHLENSAKSRSTPAASTTSLQSTRAFGPSRFRRLRYFSNAARVGSSTPPSSSLIAASRAAGLRCM